MEFNQFLRRELDRTDTDPEDIIESTDLRGERVLEILRGSKATGVEQNRILEFLNGADRVSIEQDPATTVVQARV